MKMKELVKESAPVKSPELNIRPPAPYHQLQILRKQGHIDPETKAKCATYYKKWMKMIDYGDGVDKAPSSWKG